jgi:hypothetical protein
MDNTIFYLIGSIVSFVAGYYLSYRSMIKSIEQHEGGSWFHVVDRKVYRLDLDVVPSMLSRDDVEPE